MTASWRGHRPRRAALREKETHEKCNHEGTVDRAHGGSNAGRLWWRGRRQLAAAVLEPAATGYDSATAATTASAAAAVGWFRAAADFGHGPGHHRQPQDRYGALR